MPVSYKVCLLSQFERNRFTSAQVFYGDQLPYDGTGLPETSVRLSPDSVSFEDFRFYSIDHEIEESTIGRLIGGQRFDAYIRKGQINSFISEEKNLMFLSGKKRDVLDFCKHKSKVEGLKFKTVSIDMNRLLDRLPHIKTAWFSFDSGTLNASALMGVNVENTPDFQKYKRAGNISTLAFPFTFDEMHHPVMVTADGTIVLQASYPTKSVELAICNKVKSELLESVITED